MTGFNLPFCIQRSWLLMTFRKHKLQSYILVEWQPLLHALQKGTRTSEWGGRPLSPGQRGLPHPGLPLSHPLSQEPVQSQFGEAGISLSGSLPCLSTPGNLGVIANCSVLSGDRIWEIWNQIHGWYSDFSGPPSHSNAKNTIFQEKEVARKINNFETRDREKALGS